MYTTGTINLHVPTIVFNEASTGGKAYTFTLTLSLYLFTCSTHRTSSLAFGEELSLNTLAKGGDWWQYQAGQSFPMRRTT